MFTVLLKTLLHLVLKKCILQNNNNSFGDRGAIIYCQISCKILLIIWCMNECDEWKDEANVVIVTS